MAYNDKETAISTGAPFYLYEFQVAGVYYRYTSLLNNFTYNSNTFEAAAISHGDIKQTRELSKNQLKVSLPLSNPLAQLYINTPPESVVSFTLFRGHVGEPDLLVVWKGRVTAITPEKTSMDLKCLPISESLNRPGLRMRFQRSCPHGLYDSSCGLDKEAFAVAGTATASATYTVTVTEAALQADGYYTGGMLKAPDGTLRFIRSHAGDQVTLVKPIASLNQTIADSGTAAVSLYPGCDRSRQTCNDRFSNLNNYLGFDWIPNINPFGGSSLT